MKSRKPKVFFVTPSFQSFVLQDIKILTERYDLIINTYNWTRKELAPFYLIAQFLHLLSRINEVKIIFVHFGGYWSFFPALLGKIFNKPVYIVLHGTDCASIPQLNYGSLRIPLLKWFCKKSYEWASLLLPVSESLVSSENNFLDNGKPIGNGVLFHFPKLTTAYKVIHNGFDETFWQGKKTEQRHQKSFISVLSPSQFILKGGDLIVELAKRLKDCQFTIVGMDNPKGLEVPENLKFLGKLPHEKLKSEFLRHSYYFQLSSFEGFGCALCEAMLCGCIPIVSKVNILPEIVGDNGEVIPIRDLNKLEKTMKRRIPMPISSNDTDMVRQRIIERYSLRRRKEQLFSVLPY
ncbi:glycosyltransferase family 4 protein [Cecembia rubra]|uniref:Glycosyltransferase involved in cell wall biosynthesis n=1 Tax=Cecembia rubra TaxID=1485585 RepID=A0A2P8ED14_9BACT|nr:glycosyltransferase family 4 protein [Cecembia rubra]PSL07317.1 glycosyltransferase involved in cell wall biosynthesis [Cecembia rubra]